MIKEDNYSTILLRWLILQPKVFMIENVKGLATHNKGETLKTILNEFDKLNKYKLYYKVLNSNDYNVPQKRERLFIVGH